MYDQRASGLDSILSILNISKRYKTMTRIKWLIVLVSILGLGVLLAGCGSKNEPVKNPAAPEQVAEQPVVEAPKVEEPKQEAPAPIAAPMPTPAAPTPAAPTPAAPTPAAPTPTPAAPAMAGPPALNVPHESRDNCAMCHSGGAMLVKVKPNHAIGSNTPICSTCHKINFK